MKEENQNIMLMNVVGIDHYLKYGEKEELFAELEQIMNDSAPRHAPYVNFEWDRENKFAPVCFVAKYNYKKIGTLQADMVDEALSIVDEHGRFTGVICGWGGKAITIYVDDEDGELRAMALADKCNDRITTSALDGIGRMAYLERENEFEERTDDLLDFLGYYRRNNMPPDERLLSMLFEWNEVYGNLHRRTMSREDHGVIKRMRMLLNPLEGEEKDAFYTEDGELLEEIRSIYYVAFDLHRHTTQNNGALEIMNYQLDHLREIAHRRDGFIDDYKKVYLYKADEAMIREEYDRIEHWLRTALPYNVYARYSDDKPKLASNLFYLRLTRAELYNVYEHMLVLEELEFLLNHVGTEGLEYGGKLKDVKSLTCYEGFEEYEDCYDEEDLITHENVQEKEQLQLANADERLKLVNIYLCMLLILWKKKVFTPGVEKKWIHDQLVFHLLSKTGNDNLRILRDNVWVKIETTRKGSISYKGATLSRLFELLGLWSAQKHIIVGSTKLSDIIARIINNSKGRETIRVQIQKNKKIAESDMKSPERLPSIMQLFLIKPGSVQP